jgi:hypothetical protein
MWKHNNKDNNNKYKNKARARQILNLTGIIANLTSIMQAFVID